MSGWGKVEMSSRCGVLPRGLAGQVPCVRVVNHRCSMTPHEPRRYRRLVAPEGLVAFEVAVGETDLMVMAQCELRDEARAAAKAARRQIQSHGALNPKFLEARRPLEEPDGAPEIVSGMYRAARIAGTGPMAAVAGAVAEYVARELKEHSDEIIVENGGDLFIISAEERRVAVTAPGSPMDGQMALVIPPGERAVCTSSGTVGHSDSGGSADAVVVAAAEGTVADAVATATANRVVEPADVEAAIEWSRERDDLQHVLIMCGETIAAWGEFEFASVAATVGNPPLLSRPQADSESDGEEDTSGA